VDDLTVNFRGARKARVRPTDVPSSSTPPAPSTSTTHIPTPPGLSAQDSQRFKSMLQSLHQGQILLMQSLQVVAPLGSILTVEQFIEKVSWPGTLPSLEREGGGPSAQVPRQVQDASSEATIPEPFIFEADETQVRQEAATPERSPHISLDPPSPVVDQSSL